MALNCERQGLSGWSVDFPKNDHRCLSFADVSGSGPRSSCMSSPSTYCGKCKSDRKPPWEHKKLQQLSVGTLTAVSICASHRGEVKIRTSANQWGGLEEKWTKVKAVETYLALMGIQEFKTLGKRELTKRTLDRQWRYVPDQTWSPLDPFLQTRKYW